MLIVRKKTCRVNVTGTKGGKGRRIRIKTSGRKKVRGDVHERSMKEGEVGDEDLSPLLTGE